METAFAPVLRMLEKGWQFGAVVMAFAVSAWIMDRYDFPSPGVFKEWLPVAAWAGTAGFAIVLISGGREIIERIDAWRVKRAERKADEKNVMANLQTLTPQEEEAHDDALSRQRTRFDVSDHDVIYYRLIYKKVLVPVEHSIGRSICKLHPAILKNRKTILARLNAATPAAAEKQMGRRMWS
jgi:hypothetical protein